VAYLVLQASLPVNVVLGQELSPRHAGIISSLLMGAAWGLGAHVVQGTITPDRIPEWSMNT